MANSFPDSPTYGDINQEKSNTVLKGIALTSSNPTEDAIKELENINPVDKSTSQKQSDCEIVISKEVGRLILEKFKNNHNQARNTYSSKRKSTKVENENNIKKINEEKENEIEKTNQQIKDKENDTKSKLLHHSKNDEVDVNGIKQMLTKHETEKQEFSKHLDKIKTDLTEELKKESVRYEDELKKLRLEYKEDRNREIVGLQYVCRVYLKVGGMFKGEKKYTNGMITKINPVNTAGIVVESGGTVLNVNFSNICIESDGIKQPS
jgi:hypothetical protein